jgi:hypothetical protein
MKVCADRRKSTTDTIAPAKPGVALTATGASNDEAGMPDVPRDGFGIPGVRTEDVVSATMVSCRGNQVAQRAAVLNLASHGDSPNSVGDHFGIFDVEVGNHHANRVATREFGREGASDTVRCPSHHANGPFDPDDERL